MIFDFFKFTMKISKFFWQKLFFTISIFLTLLIGFLSGILFEKIKIAENREEIVIKKLETPIIPLIHLQKIENGVLYGKNEGKEVRFIIGEKKEEIMPIKKGFFSFKVETILPMLKKLSSPPGANFAASKRGKKFFPLDHPRAFLLSPKNRIFFKDKEEAWQKGYEEG